MRVSSFKGKVQFLIEILNYSLYKNSIYLIASTFLGAGMGFIFWIIAARLYSVEDFGLASAMISAIGLISSLSILGLNIGLIRFLPEIKDKASLIGTCMIIVTVVSLLLSLVFLLGVNLWAQPLAIIRERPILTLLFILFCVLPSNNNLLRMGVFIGFREAKYSFIQTVVIFMRILALPIFVALGAVGIFISFGITSIFAYIVGIYILYKIYNYKIKFFVNKKILKVILPYSVGNYLAALLASLPTYVLPILVVNVLGAKTNAYFYVAWMVSYLLLTISENVSTSLLAEGSYNQEKLYIISKKAFKFSSLIVIVLAVLIFSFGNYVLLIFGKQFEQESFQLLRILIIANMFYIINSIYIAVKRVEKNIREIIYLYGFLSFFTIINSYILIQYIGLAGVGIAWLLSNIIVATGIILSKRCNILH